MTERKFENKILWIILYTLFLVLFITLASMYNGSINYNFKPLSTVMTSPSFIGSITGTIISGIIAIVIMNSQFRQSVKIKTIEDMNKELKAIRFFTETVQNINNALSFIYIVGKEDNELDKLQIKRNRLINHQTQNILGKIKDEDFSPKNHEHYIKILNHLIGFQTEIELFEENSSYYKNQKHIGILSEHRDGINSYTKELQKAANEIEYKLNKF